MRTRRRSKLRTRMTISYMAVSVAAVLSLETLLAFIIFFVIVYSPALDNMEYANAKQIAHAYAQMASTRTGAGTSLNPQLTFNPDVPSALTYTDTNDSNPRGTSSIPYIISSYSGPQPTPFALIIAPDGFVLASSYPSQYSAHFSTMRLSSLHYALIAHALKTCAAHSLHLQIGVSGALLALYKYGVP